MALIAAIGWGHLEVVVVQLLLIGAVVIAVAPGTAREHHRLYPAPPTTPGPVHCVPISGGHGCPGG